ncbi:hypothetical protein SORBI_3002G275400 [Sorghum bicolor]|uniref:Uncharacterized protein n=1 Tax=Sorghum bicolor TaxID=4558 RepID=A0A1B6QDS4_SORBI|nr:hypothetical protein SORBI_3002G275400 [Sorghum bicolor]
MIKHYLHNGIKSTTIVVLDYIMCRQVQGLCPVRFIL